MAAAGSGNPGTINSTSPADPDLLQETLPGPGSVRILVAKVFSRALAANIVVSLKIRCSRPDNASPSPSSSFHRLLNKCHEPLHWKRKPSARPPSTCSAPARKLSRV